MTGDRYFDCFIKVDVYYQSVVEYLIDELIQLGFDQVEFIGREPFPGNAYTSGSIGFISYNPPNPRSNSSEILIIFHKRHLVIDRNSSIGAIKLSRIIQLLNKCNIKNIRSGKINNIID